MGLKDKLLQVVTGARKLWQPRDPDSYARYEHNRDYERKRADHERHDQEVSAEQAREKEERTHGFEDRYAAEHEGHVEREREDRPDSS